MCKLVGQLRKKLISNRLHDFCPQVTSDEEISAKGERRVKGYKISLISYQASLVVLKVLITHLDDILDEVLSWISDN